MIFKEYVNGNDKAIIILHEIYGINKHIEDVCQYYLAKGYDIYCPDLLNMDNHFEYSQQDEAYLYFTNNIGLDVFHQINIQIKQLKKKYKKVILIGFSIGATIAWICTSSGLCDGMIGYYGSRIRDYLSVIPKCPSLLLFAEEDYFDVVGVVEFLKNNKSITTEIIEGKHGFLNCYSENYNRLSCEIALKLTEEFLSDSEKSGFVLKEF